MTTVKGPGEDGEEEANSVGREESDGTDGVPAPVGASQTRSQARAQAVLTLTPRGPLDGTPAVPQLRANLDRGPNLEGTAPSRKEVRGSRRSSSFSVVVGCFPGISRNTVKGPGEDGVEKEANYVEEQAYDGTDGVPAPVGESQGSGGPTIAVTTTEKTPPNCFLWKSKPP
ncbi:hypothetical protein O181_125456 [Austropuccinia psidii MF-1]|uniref:Uncharacterized protein n=1 Tax=Austropuccinia psidii MF-1 TaxID=1389203 RepID=A0A9Q3Q520_9BASI|nr:hypothetical protein [Austropuccinia psidii MF-1]